MPTLSVHAIFRAKRICLFLHFTFANGSQIQSDNVDSRDASDYAPHLHYCRYPVYGACSHHLYQRSVPYILQYLVILTSKFGAPLFSSFFSESFSLARALANYCYDASRQGALLCDRLTRLCRSRQEQARWIGKVGPSVIKKHNQKTYSEIGQPLNCQIDLTSGASLSLINLLG